MVELFRGLILRGEWKPGAPIVETAIAKAVGVSQPTVREALKHLEAEGLILITCATRCGHASCARAPPPM